jgi:predicted metal-dependent hydrolase
MYQYQDIQYEVRHTSRKTASIYIERDGTVSLRVPKGTSDLRVEKILESRRKWIYKSLAEWRLLNASRVQRQYVNGEGFLYLGRSYRLRLLARAASPLTLKGGYFQLHVNGGDCAKHFKDFYREKGLSRIPARVEYFAKRLGLDVRGIRVMELKNRWGSCSSNRYLNFHWKCMMAPLTVIDYIIVHELAHLRHKRHTQAFWGEIDKVLPDYKERIEWLRSNGSGMSL